MIHVYVKWIKLEVTCISRVTVQMIIPTVQLPICTCVNVLMNFTYYGCSIQDSRDWSLCSTISPVLLTYLISPSSLKIPFTLAKELHPGKYHNPVHWFIRLLQEKGVLLRNYTQNIDGLERCYVYVRKDNVCTVYSLYCKFKNFSRDIIFAVAWFSMKFSSLKINISLILS